MAFTMPLSFEAGIKPLAQVTVVDGGRGDCNLIDFCRLDPPDSNATLEAQQKFSNGAWSRTLIDTGVGKAQTLATIWSLIRTLRLPTAPNVFNDTAVPRLHEMQITHPDDDHIGNAVGLLQRWLTAPTGIFYNKFDKCRVTFSAIPELYCAPKIVVEQGKPGTMSLKTGNSTVNVAFSRVIVRGTLDQTWLGRLRQAGFYPEVEIQVVDNNGTPVNLVDAATSLSQIGYGWTLAPKSNQALCHSRVSLSYTEACAKSHSTYSKAQSRWISIGSGTQFNVRARTRIFYRDSYEYGVSGQKQAIVFNAKVAKLKTRLVAHTATPEWLFSPDVISASLTTNKTFQVDWASDKPPVIGPVYNPSSAQVGSGNSTRGFMTEMRPRTSLPAPIVKKSLIEDGDDDDEALHRVRRNARSLMNFELKIQEVCQKVVIDDNGNQKRLILEPRCPNLRECVMPYPSGDYAEQGKQWTLGPSQAQYADMMRNILMALWTWPDQDRSDFSIVIAGDATNRSSIVTMFERPGANQNAAKFTMLFTGDAHDKACDIRDTLVTWMTDSNFRPGPSIKVDVLKIPHHGSDNTTSAGFYSFVQADTYLVCGDFHNKHGNPKESTLTAIVKSTFDRKAPGEKPIRIFFSCPTILKDFTPPPGKNGKPRNVFRSPVVALNSGWYKPTNSAGKYFYEMYALRPSTDTTLAAWGSVLFGRDASGNTVVTWDTGRWVKVSIDV